MVTVMTCMDYLPMDETLIQFHYLTISTYTKDDVKKMLDRGGGVGWRERGGGGAGEWGML